jgi:hypothetical protein
VRPSSIVNEFWVPAVAMVLFFLFQARGHLSELTLTLFAIGIASLLYYWHDRVGERYLFFLGVVIGSWIEIGFRFLGYQQVWADASFFGVPYWLPLAWGIGFVIVTRLGVWIRGLKVTD